MDEHLPVLVTDLERFFIVVKICWVQGNDPSSAKEAMTFLFSFACGNWKFALEEVRVELSGDDVR